MAVYNIKHIPCDTALREILDNLDPVDIRSMFKTIYQKLQRGKALEKLMFMEGCYLLNLDGTGYFSSTTRHSPACNKKIDSETGEVTNYYMHILGAAIVHPDYKEVIPICPQPIQKQDGIKKNDCERNAAKRFLADLRRDHPHLQLIINEDALSSNAPHIADLERHNLHYILGVKEGDHTYLFRHVDTAIEKREFTEFTVDDMAKPHIRHSFRFLNEVPLNKSHQDTLVNFIEYWEENTTTG